MSATFERIRALVRIGDIKISDHGYDEISDENILVRDVIEGVLDGIVVEDYPDLCEGALRADISIGSRPTATSCRLGNPKEYVVTGGCCYRL